MNHLWLRPPMQVPSVSQWWSKCATHLLHTLHAKFFDVTRLHPEISGTILSKHQAVSTGM